jgi:hypothetical protein
MSGGVVERPNFGWQKWPILTDATHMAYDPRFVDKYTHQAKLDNKPAQLQCVFVAQA